MNLLTKIYTNNVVLSVTSHCEEYLRAKADLERKEDCTEVPKEVCKEVPVYKEWFEIKTRCRYDFLLETKI